MDQLNQALPIDLTRKIMINEKAVKDCIHEGDAMNEERHINLTIDEGLELKLSNVREHLKLPDDMSVLTLAISLYSKLVDDKKAGREVRIHEKNGRQYRLEFERGT